MAVVRLEAFKTLQARIAQDIPDLEQVLVQRDPGKTECLPSLVITPVRFRYYPDQEESRFIPDRSHLVVNVGRHEGIVQLRLTAPNLTKRWEYEQRLLDVFLGTEGHPGVLLTHVTACPALGDVLAAWELEDDEWDNAKAFDNRYESVIVLTGIIPALVTRAGVYPVEHLQLGLSVATNVNTTLASATGVDFVEIQADGSFLPVT